MDRAAPKRPLEPLKWGVAAALACLLLGLLVHQAVFSSQLDEQRRAATRRLESYALSLQALLDRNEALPALLALEPRLGLLLDERAPAARDTANRYLQDVAAAAKVSAAYLMNAEGLTVAASNWDQAISFVGQNYRFRPYFQQAVVGKFGRFYGVGVTTGEPGYFLTSRLRTPAGRLGVAAVKLNLDPFEDAMEQSGEPLLLSDRDGVVFLSAVPHWKYRVLAPLSHATRARIEQARQYGGLPLPPLREGLALGAGGSEARLLHEGAERNFSIVTQPVGQLGWRMMLLVDQGDAHRAALVSGSAAALAAAVLFGIAMHLRLNRQRHEERVAAEARLRDVHQQLEHRIAERTAALTTANLSLEQKVAELERTEAILRQTRDSAVQAGKLAVLGQMSAGMSHELNQPLAALHTLSDNAIQLLAQQRVDETRENLALISQLAARMGRIVRQLKSFARKGPAHLEPVNVADAVDQALLIVEPRRSEADATIDVEPPQPPLRVRADATRLVQVLVNLIRNGLDEVATLDDRRLSIRAQAQGDRIAIRIRDSGPGLSAQVLPHLFEPFYTTKPVGQGLGLGLALSHAIVQGLGGRLEGRNPDGGGAEFTVTLDAAPLPKDDRA
nr:ATP-binding protein [Caldimonas mangrovi]